MRLFWENHWKWINNRDYQKSFVYKNKMKLETLDILVMLNRRSVTDHKPDNFEECGTGWCVLTFGWR